MAAVVCRNTVAGGLVGRQPGRRPPAHLLTCSCRCLPCVCARTHVLARAALKWCCSGSCSYGHWHASHHTPPVLTTPRISKVHHPSPPLPHNAHTCMCAHSSTQASARARARAPPSHTHACAPCRASCTAPCTALQVYKRIEDLEDSVQELYPQLKAKVTAAKEVGPNDTLHAREGGGGGTWRGRGRGQFRAGAIGW